MSNYISIPVAASPASGTTSGTSADQLVDAGQDFLTSVTVGDVVWNTTDETSAIVTNVVDDDTLDLSDDIIVSGNTFIILSPTEVASSQLVNGELVVLVVASSTIETVLSLGTAANNTVTIAHAPNANAAELIQDAILAPKQNTRPYQPNASVEGGSDGLLVESIAVS